MLGSRVCLSTGEDDEYKSEDKDEDTSVDSCGHGDDTHAHGYARNHDDSERSARMGG